MSSSSYPWTAPCVVPDGESGEWKVESFEVNRMVAAWCNLDLPSRHHVEPGTYKRLVHSLRGTVMSNTRMEWITARHAIEAASGRVLVSGLGLGLVLNEFLAKPNVEHVTVLEYDQDVINLVLPTFEDNPRVKIWQADAIAYDPEPGETYDFAWHDIWDDISQDNLPLMTKLTRKWQRRIPVQHCWGREEARRERREMQRNPPFWLIRERELSQLTKRLENKDE